MTSKSIHTLVDDIYALFEGPHKVSDEALGSFKEDVGRIVKESLEEAGVARPFELRMSNIGLPDRKLWYQNKTKEAWNPQPRDCFKFLYGHLVEALVLFLVKEAGHKVERAQEVVELDGIKGHIDCVIDGVLVDIKSASTFSFNKFTSGRIAQEDPFGYLHQLSGYFQSIPTDSEETGWLVADKQDGRLAFISYEHFELPDASEKITRIRKIIDSDTPPEKCYEPKKDKHGNMELSKGCQLCEFKTECWPEMRVFRYATNDAFYTSLEKVPRVKEVTDEYREKAKILFGRKD